MNVAQIRCYLSKPPHDMTLVPFELGQVRVTFFQQTRYFISASKRYLTSSYLPNPGYPQSPYKCHQSHWMLPQWILPLQCQQHSCNSSLYLIGQSSELCGYSQVLNWMWCCHNAELGDQRRQQWWLKWVRWSGGALGGVECVPSGESNK